MAKTNPVFRAPTAYEEEMLRAQRQQQLAEVLRQQAFMQEPESPTYQGFRAMPSPTNALARILSAYTSKKIGEKAEEAERKAREADVAEFEALRRDLGPQTQVTGPDMFGDPMEMAGKYTPPVTQTVMPTPQEREDRLVQAMATGGPRAQRYAELMLSRQPKPQTMEFGDQLLNITDGVATPVTMGGKPVTASPKPAAGSSLMKLVSERDQFKPGDPRIAIWDAAISKETTTQPPFKIDLGDKGSLVGQEIILKEIGSMRPRAYAATNIIRAVNNLDRLTQKGTFTGSLAPTAVGAGQFLNSIGLKIAPETLSNTEAFNAQVSDLVMAAQAALGGARGFTKEETAILMQMFPQIINSPQARVAIGNIIRGKQLEVIDEYDSLIDDYKSTFKDSLIPYKKIDDDEVRYQRWLRSQRGR